jgi:Holliday junction resolvasome RuvABC DNA-binding subunit
MSVKMRQHVERQIARRLVMDAIAAGYSINIDNGGDEMELEKPSKNLKEILGAMFATDDERLYLFRDEKDKPYG